ncbi:hypothetical protein NDI43_27540 [Microcoleus vaginatus GB2-A3]|uniref:hypothetical protein n=1 Tax=Microcoleus vaginatus TaxID=119532 RepID=UPI0032ACF372
MLENAITRSPAQTKLDPATHAECLEFVRSAIASNDRTTAHDIAAVLKDCYQQGYIDRAAIWADLSETEQQQFQELLAPPPIVREFVARIREALGHQSPAVAGAIQTDLERAIDCGSISAADVVAVVGAVEFAEFDRLACG